MSRDNGSVIGVDNTPTTSAASGVWSMNAVARAVKAAIWPNNEPTLGLDFDETTTLDSRITFTRATSATYFDYSGVLQTASSGVARFDHRLESGVWVNKGLLIEEQRTNVLLYSEELNNAAQYSLVRGTVSANTVTAPDGTTTAETYTEDLQTGAHGINNSANRLNATTSTTYTSSGFIKKKDRTYGAITIEQFNNTTFVGSFILIINLDTGDFVNTLTAGTAPTNTSYSIQDCGNGWYRISVTGTTASSGVNKVGWFLAQTNSTSTLSYTGDDTSGSYMWGAQLEAGAFPTSYIKTTTASVTRNADQAVMTGTDFSDWFNATEGTVFTQFSVPVINNTVTAYFPNASCIDDNSDNEAMRVSLNSKNSGASDEETFTAVIRDGGSDVAVGDSALVNLNGQTNKAAYVYKVNDFAFSGNGGSVATDTSLTLPTVNRLNIGSQPSLSTRYLGGHVAKFYYWNTRKSNTFLQSITG